MTTTGANGVTTAFASKAQLHRKAALAEYIRKAKEDIDPLNTSWPSHRWPGVGNFTKLGVKTGSRAKDVKGESLLDSGFMDFAKAHIRERHMQNPSESRSMRARLLQALRVVEASLLQLRDSADPLMIDRMVLDRAAALTTEFFTGASPYLIASTVQAMAERLATLGILPLDLKDWRSPVTPLRNVGLAVGSEGDKKRLSRLPDQEAVEVLASIFSRDLDPTDERVHRDIYTTSVTALLMCAPSRGQEIHNLPANLVVKATDRFGEEQMGLRLDASKGFGAYVKWVWKDMVPVAEKALTRLMVITEEARSLARHYENPETCNLFYRHANCPDVGEDEPLTTEQACAALGLSMVRPLHSVGLRSRQYVHTLRSLWTQHVLPRHRKDHPHFPYVSKKDKARGKKGGLKFSEALFCMRSRQLFDGPTSPVFLWMPRLSSSYARDVSAAKATTKNIFERYGYTGENGAPLFLRSHQPRHLINTEAQRNGLSDRQIAHWSGRKNIKQNETYDDRPEQERVEETRAVVEAMDARLVPQRSDASPYRQDGYWRIDVGPKPASCSDLEDIQPRLSGLQTLYGACYHDWALAPCEGFVACLDCEEHECIKGSDDNSQEKLKRIEELHSRVLAEVKKAQAAVASQEWGAQDWLETQSRYAAKLEQLIAILNSADVPDQSVIRLAGAHQPQHLERAMRRIALKALEDNTAPEDVMRRMLGAIESHESGTQPIAMPTSTRLQSLKLKSSLGEPKHGT